ncbi:hypothetical protein Dimus_022016 [Dionaea muscipula]
MSTGRGEGRNIINGGKANNNITSNTRNNELGSIPAAAKMVVQSLKEVVNYPELEIYATLKECNMNPDEAVERLLAQGHLTMRRTLEDQFHEVKSKREKKKEVKDAPDSRSHGASKRGSKGGAGIYSGRGGTSQFTSSESDVSRGKPTHKKDNEPTTHVTSASPSAGSLGNNVTQRAFSSGAFLPGSKAFTGEKHEGILSLHPASGFQPVCSGVHGQKSMADIVKMGMPYGKASNIRNQSQQSDNHHIMPHSGPHDLLSTEHYPAMVSELHPNLEVAKGHHVPPDDDWPVDAQPFATSLSSNPDPSVDSVVYIDPSNVNYDGLNQQLHAQSDEVQYAVDDEFDNAHSSLLGSVSVADKNLHKDSSQGTSIFDNDLYKNVSSYQLHQHAFDPQGVEDVGVSVSSVTRNLQKLTLEKEDEDSSSETGSPAVKIPEHLQVQSADCSHLSFGSFGSGMTGPFSGPFAAYRPLKNDVEEDSVEAEAPSVGNSDTGNQDYYADEHLLSTSGGNTAPRLNGSAGTYDTPSSQTDILEQEAPQLARDQYPFSSSTPNYVFEDNRSMNPLLAHSQPNAKMQNLPPLSGVMAYSNSLPSGLSVSNDQTVRESELPYSAFSTTQSMPTKYSSNMSSISGPTISLTEALKTGNFSSSAQPSLTGNSISGGAALQQQHLAVHPYSQPSLPVGPFANMVGLSFLPQSYTYMPPVFQQPFAGNSSYHQSLAAILPQYKNSLPVSSLPQSAAAASAYGAFGSSTPGNFPLNQPTTPAGTSMAYDDMLRAQYKDANHMISLQQNERSPLWAQGPGTRTMSAVPASTYYSFQGERQQLTAGFRQSQQASQHYGNHHGYQNFYQSQSELSLEHQQLLSRDGSGGRFQGQSKQSQQNWQSNY